MLGIYSPPPQHVYSITLMSQQAFGRKKATRNRGEQEYKEKEIDYETEVKNKKGLTDKTRAMQSEGVEIPGPKSN